MNYYQSRPPRVTAADKRRAAEPTAEERAKQLTLQVLSQASKEQPADRILHQVLKKAHRLPDMQRRAVVQNVFGFYRWFGWIRPEWPVEKQLNHAQACHDRFMHAPAQFSTAELQQKAIPHWALDHVTVTREWLVSLQKEPPLWLRALTGTGSQLKRELGDCRLLDEAAFADCLKYQGRQDLFQTDAFHEGKFEVQDLSSQMVGFLCAPQPGEKWWDACAGEGGKTLHLADLMRNEGLIWATDRSVRRLQSLKLRTARAKVFNYRAAPWDGGSHLPTRTLFDGVLVDAPCTGIGTWHRNPHARWTTTPLDVQELAVAQFNLLKHVSAGVKPGGKLVYAVCTLSQLETVELARRFDQEVPGFAPLPAPNPLQPQKPPASWHWFWPHEHGGNGMFVALWQKVK